MAMIASYNAWMSCDKLNVFVQLIHLQAALMIIKVLEVPNLLNLLSFVSAYSGADPGGGEMGG